MWSSSTVTSQCWNVDVKRHDLLKCALFEMLSGMASYKNESQIVFFFFCLNAVEPKQFVSGVVTLSPSSKLKSQPWWKREPCSCEGMRTLQSEEMLAAEAEMEGLINTIMTEHHDPVLPLREHIYCDTTGSLTCSTATITQPPCNSVEEEECTPLCLSYSPVLILPQGLQEKHRKKHNLTPNRHTCISTQVAGQERCAAPSCHPPPADLLFSCCSRRLLLMNYAAAGPVTSSRLTLHLVCGLKYR